MSKPKGPSRRELMVGAGVLGMAGCRSEEPPLEGREQPESPPDPHQVRKSGGKAHNLVVVLVDDQRHDAASIAGHPFLKTPHMDALAEQGVWCRNAFVTTSLCSPSRATMLCGQYAHSHGVLNNQSPLPEEIPTWPELVKKAGFRTAYVGKWHMGGASAEPRPHWDHWVSFPGQGRYVYPGQMGQPEEKVFNVNGQPTAVSGYVTDLVTERAVSWLKQQRKGAPFALVVGHKACHAPFTPAPRHAEAYRDERVPRPLPDTDTAYAGRPEWLRRMRESLVGVGVLYDGRWKSFVEWYLADHRTLLAVDESLGKILQTLDEQGLTDDTLVVFTSDNGFMVGERGVLDKRCAYDESIRVPWFARLPGVIPEGTRCDELVINLDLPSTLLDAAGLIPPHTMEGRSILPMLRGEGPRWRDAILYEYFFERAFPQCPTVLAVRTRTAKLVSYHGVWERAELFDLVSDPGETQNRIDDPEWAQKK